MLKESADAAIVQAIIGLAHNLGLRVVAEGIDNHEALTRLKHLHCDIVQGYLLAQPVPIEELQTSTCDTIHTTWLNCL